jgi:serine/threonine protein phosphatase 1
VRPGVPLDEQDPSEMMWIRAPFLESASDFGALVVHGHTPVPEVVERANRIDIDTGAVYGGHLTAACFWGTERRFLQVGF